MSPADDVERVRWAMEFRGRLSVAELRAGAAAVRAHDEPTQVSRYARRTHSAFALAVG